MSPVHYLLFTLLCVIWGSSFMLMKKASLAFGPLTIAGLRCLSGVGILLVIWALLKRSRLPVRKELPWLGLVCLLGYGIPYSIQPYLVAKYGGGFIGMMVSFVPLMTILVSMPILRVFPTRWQVIGVGGGLGCIAVIMADGLNRAVPWHHLAVALGVPLSYATANTIIKRHLSTIAPAMLTLLCMSVVALVILPAGVGVEPIRSGSSLGLSLASVIALGVFGTGLATVVFFKLVQDQGPLFAGLVTYVVPLGALLWGWLDAERVSALQLVALVGVLVMVAVVQVDIARQSARARACSR